MFIQLPHLNPLSYKNVGYTETFSGCSPQDIIDFIEENESKLAFN